MIKKFMVVLTVFLLLTTLMGCKPKVVGCVDINTCNIFTNGLLAVEKDSKWGYINTTGKEKIAFEFERAYAFYNDTAIVRVDGKFQLINSKGKTLLDKAYDALSWDVNTGLLWYKDDATYGLMKPNGSKLTEPTFDAYRQFSSGVAAVKKGSTWGYINGQGKLEIDYMYEDASSFSNGLAAVRKTGEYGYINIRNKTVIDFQYQDANSFDSYGRAIVTTKSGDDTTYHMINDRNKVILSGERISGFGPLYRFKDGNNWYLYTTSGKKFNTASYNTIWSVNEYLVNVEDDTSDRMDLFDTKGKIIYSVTYNDYRRTFEDGNTRYIYSIIDSKVKVFDGKTTHDFDVERIHQIKNKWIVAENDGKIGIIDFNGNIIIPYEYDELFISHDGFIVFEKDAKIGFMNTKGKVVIEALYTNMNPDY